MEYIFFIGLPLVLFGFLYLKTRSLKERVENLEYLSTAHSHYLDEKARSSSDPKDELDFLESSYDYALRRVLPEFRKKMVRELLDTKSELKKSPPSSS